MADAKVNYAAFAKFLSHYPEEVTLLRFRELNIRNLLFYQAELVHLGRQLQQIEEKDAVINPDTRKRSNRRWTPLTAVNVTATTTQAGAPSTISDIYREKMLVIRSTLAKYSECPGSVLF